MTTLTNSAIFTVGDAATAVESVALTILPAAASGSGSGRLIHPTLGTYDYSHMPDQWTNIDGDIIVAPIWSSAKTLIGAANTLMQGHVRDVTVTERWTFAVPVAHLRALLLHWQNPPDPSVGFVQWWPNYTSTLGFKVALTDLTVGSEAVTLDWISLRHNMVVSDVALKLRIIDRV